MCVCRGAHEGRIRVGKNAEGGGKGRQGPFIVDFEEGIGEAK